MNVCFSECVLMGCSLLFTRGDVVVFSGVLNHGYFVPYENRGQPRTRLV